jgi:hypothetical protein
VTEQIPEIVEQQPPEGQGVGEQTEPRALKVLPVVQLAATVRVQAAVELLQQAPVQGLGEQTEPLPLKKVLAPVQRAAVEEVQTPETVLQQAPPQGFGVQAEPRVVNVLGLTQPVAMVDVQPPVVEQHAPTQTLGVQKLPTL